jgi:hypothetical protein
MWTWTTHQVLARFLAPDFLPGWMVEGNNDKNDQSLPSAEDVLASLTIADDCRNRTRKLRLALLMSTNGGCCVLGTPRHREQKPPDKAGKENRGRHAITTLERSRNLLVEKLGNLAERSTSLMHPS